MTTIRPLDLSKIQVAASTISEAFYDDPMFDLVLPDKTTRLQYLTPLTEFTLKLVMNNGQVDSIAGTGGVALWMPPGKTDLSLGQIMKAGGLKLPFRTGFGPFMRLMRLLDKGSVIHKKLVPGPHWYLAMVAVEPSQQGKGLGKALIEHGLARADADRVPCYLETSNERNLPLYERSGFKVVESFVLVEGGPSGWGMLRDAVVA